MDKKLFHKYIISLIASEYKADFSASLDDMFSVPVNHLFSNLEYMCRKYKMDTKNDSTSAVLVGVMVGISLYHAFSVRTVEMEKIVTDYLQWLKQQKGENVYDFLQKKVDHNGYPN